MHILADYEFYLQPLFLEFVDWFDDLEIGTTFFMFLLSYVQYMQMTIKSQWLYLIRI